MSSNTLPGYAGKVLRADLTNARLSGVVPDEATLRQYLGGTGLGMKILYDEVPPEAKWSSPQNLLIFATGPVNGTKIQGSGIFSVVTKGAMTGVATSTQAAGFMGAFIKFSGFDAVVVEGKSDHWVYLYLHGGKAELRDASHLVGKGTFETEELIKKELGGSKRGLSVFAIGPAGENLVRFACIWGDGGHVAAHNGVGAVMGSKKLKAIVVSRQPVIKTEVRDPEKLSALGKEALEIIKAHPFFEGIYNWGTSLTIKNYAPIGLLPFKNYTTNEPPKDIEKLTGPYYRKHFRLKPEPCWACQMKHCHRVEVTEGPYKGFEAEEPEFEQFSSMGCQIGVSDPGAVVMLSSEADNLGMDTNESGWAIGLIMECYEKGILSKKDLDGLEMTWGNAEAVRTMLRKIAHREGIGDVLAEGVKEAVKKLGGPAREMGVYTLEGTVPRSHDDRGSWLWMFDHVTSNIATSETMGGSDLMNPPYPVTAEHFAYQDIAKLYANRKGLVAFQDSLVLCMFGGGPFLEPAVGMVRAITGWDFTVEEAAQIGRRIATLLRVFNFKHGLTAPLNTPSPRHGSKQIDGPIKAKSVMPFLPEMLRIYYENLGWDVKTGRPLPETLKSLGLEHVIADIWE